jgi:hypothetical protein
MYRDRSSLKSTCDQHGLTDEALIEKHLKPLLQAKETKFFQHKGRVTDSRQVPAHGIRLNALDMAFRLRGSYAAPLAEDRDKGTVQVIVLDVPRPQNRLSDPNPETVPPDAGKEHPP